MTQIVVVCNHFRDKMRCCHKILDLPPPEDVTSFLNAPIDIMITTIYQSDYGVKNKAEIGTL